WRPIANDVGAGSVTATILPGTHAPIVDTACQGCDGGEGVALGGGRYVWRTKIRILIDLNLVVAVPLEHVPSKRGRGKSYRGLQVLGNQPLALEASRLAPCAK